VRKEFDLLVDDHILKWAKKEIWDDDKPPYKINERTLVGKMIFGLLIDKRKIDKPTIGNDKSILKVEFSDALAKRSPDPLKLIRVNNILEMLFKIHLQKWVDAQYELHPNRYQVMENFFKKYEIEMTQQIIGRYQKYIQRAKSRPFLNYKQLRLQAMHETKSKRTNIE
jgi:hypothetical protein